MEDTALNVGTLARLQATRSENRMMTGLNEWINKLAV